MVIVSGAIPPKHSGAGRRIYAFYKYLQENHYNPKLITFYSSDLPKDANILTVQQYNFLKKLPQVHYIILFLCSLLNVSVLCFFKKKFIANPHKSVWLVSVTPLTIASAIIFKSAGFKVITQNTLMGSDNPSRYRGPYDFFGIVRRLKALQYKLSDAITSISPLLYKATKKYYPNCVMIPNPFVNRELFTVDPSRFYLKKVLVVGRTSYRKGFDISIKTIHEVHKNDPSVQFVFLGPNNNPPKETIKFFNDSEVINKDNVLFLGYQKETLPFYLNASLLFLPSRREGFGTVYIEAMGAGLPVIAKKIEGITDYIFDEEYETIIDSEDPVLFASEIKKVLINQNKYNRLAKLGLSKVERFDQEKIFNEYITLLI